MNDFTGAQVMHYHGYNEDDSCEEVCYGGHMNTSTNEEGNRDCYYTSELQNKEVDKEFVRLQLETCVKSESVCVYMCVYVFVCACVRVSMSLCVHGLIT